MRFRLGRFYMTGNCSEDNALYHYFQWVWDQYLLGRELYFFLDLYRGQKLWVWHHFLNFLLLLQKSSSFSQVVNFFYERGYICDLCCKTNYLSWFQAVQTSERSIRILLYFEMKINLAYQCYCTHVNIILLECQSAIAWLRVLSFVNATKCHHFEWHCHHIWRMAQGTIAFEGWLRVPSYLGDDSQCHCFDG